ncbi:MAG TPA: hypothetical protein PLH94_12520 [Fimbriimonadaceae bacterium]|nr:hypothetical protein [Fimbriimonadaceae bacterium]
MRFHIIPLLALLLLIPMIGRAESSAVEGSQYAVRWAIRDRLGPDHKVVFEATNESVLSLTEMKVEGRAHVNRDDDWRVERSFRFSVKTKNDGSSCRDLSITFSNGEEFSVRGPIDTNGHNDDFLHISRPEMYQRYESGDVRFEGRARSDVTIRVFDERDRLVAEMFTQTREGRFSRVIQLPAGRYRGKVSTQDARDAEEVRFSVRTSGGDWGGTSPGKKASISITEPSDGARVDQSFTISGRSTVRSLRLRILDDRQREVLRRDIDVDGSSWKVKSKLGPGRYRVEVRSDDGRTSDVKSFEVMGSARFRVTEPAEGREMRGPRVTVAGESAERSVRVQIWDDRGNLAVGRDVPTRDGYFNTQVPLANGNYRLEVRSGSDRRAFNFAVRGGDEPSPGLKVTVRLSDPKRDGTVDGPRVTIAGNSSGSSVRVQVFDDRNNRVADRDVPTKGDYFNTQLVLNPGRYRVRAEARDRSDYEEFWFTVRGGDKDKDKDQGRDFLTVEAPKRDETVRGPRVTFSGRASGRLVTVRIWDDRNNQVGSRDVPTQDGYFNTQMQLPNGRYRVRFITQSGRQEESTFSVK